MTPRLHEYQLRLPSFEGPLDVLLSLIERERLDISDLSLVAVTDGFLDYIDRLESPTAALLAEFAGIASRLIVLKSRSMLPRPETVEVEPDPDDLAEQLREYQRMKQAAARFREQEGSGYRTFARPPVVLSTPPKIVLVAPPVAHLRRALVRTLARVKQEPEVAALRRVVTIGEMRDRLRETLSRFRRRWGFRELIGTTDRETTIVGFIALLAMLRRGEVDAEQDGLFDEIHVTPVVGGIVTPGDD